MEKSAKAKVTPKRQQTQYTCMSTSISMSLQALGVEHANERTVNKVLGALPKQGACWEQAIACCSHYGMRTIMITPASLEVLKSFTDQGYPIVIAYNPEGRQWSHASVIFDITGDGVVYIADPNIPDPDETVRIINKADFYKMWSEPYNGYLVRRPAMVIQPEIDDRGQQTIKTFFTRTASQKKKTALEILTELGDELSAKLGGKNKKPSKPNPPPKEEKNPVVTSPKQRDPNARALAESGGGGAGSHKNKQDFARGKSRNPKHKNKREYSLLEELGMALDDKLTKLGCIISEEEVDTVEGALLRLMGEDELTELSTLTAGVDESFLQLEEVIKQAHAEPRERITSKMAKGGLYGLPKLIQSSCEGAIRKVSRSATMIAKQLWKKDRKSCAFLNTHYKRTKSIPAKIILIAMKSLGPKVQLDFGEPTEKTASKGLYGYRKATVNRSLSACSRLRSEVGVVTLDLHKKRKARKEGILTFFENHNKTAQCDISQLMLSTYPEERIRMASKEVTEFIPNLDSGELEWDL